ncbi:MAG TPA: zf-HC2 domain-containing protein, partial [Pyrinomonadaceae bacterium]
MTCEKYFDLIDDLLEDELDEHTTEQVESHVFACQECRKRYETRWRAKEIYSQYLFDVEPPLNSWINFQARLVEENEKAQGDSIIPVNPPRRKKR